MDHLLSVKDDLELAIFEKLKDLFSINVKLTFYDITSSFFYTDNCEIGENGYSRDNRPEREQIVIGVVTSFEGYPIKHYVFEGNRKDETTVKDVVKELKSAYNIQIRVRAHVFICVLSLLLKRILEIHYMKGKCVMEPLEEISKSKLIKYKVKFSKREDRSQTFPKVTNTTPMQKKYFNMIGIRNPMNLEKFIW